MSTSSQYAHGHEIAKWSFWRINYSCCSNGDECNESVHSHTKNNLLYWRVIKGPYFLFCSKLKIIFYPQSQRGVWNEFVVPTLLGPRYVSEGNNICPDITGGQNISGKKSWFRIPTCQPSSFPRFRPDKIMIYAFKLLEIQGQVGISDSENHFNQNLVVYFVFFVHHFKFTIINFTNLTVDSWSATQKNFWYHFSSKSIHLLSGYNYFHFVYSRILLFE